MNRLSILSLTIALMFVTACTAAAETHTWRFDLGQPNAAEGYTAVTPTTVYSKDQPFGYDGGNKPHAFNGAKLTDGWTADGPFSFSAKLPEGNYRVRVMLGDPGQPSQTAIKAEARRYVIRPQNLQAGETEWVEFDVNVRTPALPDGGQVRINQREVGTRTWDDRLTLEFLGDHPAVDAIEITPDPDATAVYLAGDSTVVDGREEPWSGWGQMLPIFFKPGVVIANHAESGRTVSSFTAERRFEKIMSTLKKGDYVFMQFGHNDMKEHGEGKGPFLNYQSGLRAFVKAIRERGATPVLVTPMHRRWFNKDGTIKQTFGDYPKAMRQLAEQEHIPLIDLQVYSRAFYEALGPDGSKIAFVQYPAGTYPGQDKPLKDNTHHNNYGAYVLARCVVKGIRDAKLPLADKLVGNLPNFDPANPPTPDQVDVPPSYVKPIGEKPEGS